MAAFSAVNTTLIVPDPSRTGDEQTPTTPKPCFASAPSVEEVVIEDSTPSTPTRHSFGGVLGQRPLPEEPLTPAQLQDTAKAANGSLKRDGSHRSIGSDKSAELQDVEMGDGDDDDHIAEDDESDNDSTTSERPSKKKKGQRFFCTEFPPCQLSFTRSEHLARHIR